jgi:hypothetical protein
MEEFILRLKVSADLEDKVPVLDSKWFADQNKLIAEKYEEHI